MQLATLNTMLHQGINAKQALAVATQRLKHAGVSQPHLDARLLLQYALSISHEVLVAEPDRLLDEAEQEQYDALVARRAKREPLAYITGSREFWGMEFYVTPYTLDPRPDSETLIEAALEHISDKNAPLGVLDLGTGSGCLLLALLSELPAAKGLGIDKSKGAVQVARRNVDKLCLSERAAIRKGNWAEGLNMQFDVVLSNPPYIAKNLLQELMPEVAHYEPHMALTDEADGLQCYRDIAVQLNSVLTDDGFAVIELGQGQVEAVALLFKDCGFTVVEIRNDLQGIARCLVLTKMDS